MAMFECFVCGKKIKLMQDMAQAADKKYVCADDVNYLLGTDKATNTAIPRNLKKRIKRYTSDELLALNKSNSQDKSELCCPYCGSTNINTLGADKKNFSVGKAAAGAILTGGVGLLAGFAGKKTGKTNFVCMNCGKQFQK
jgi:predicted RNA-binding Zn-ribbon protein involved in translation (DUF1610 family)